jgi:hypothetical protein
VRETQLEGALTADLASWCAIKAGTDDLLGVAVQLTRGGPGARTPTHVTNVAVSAEYLPLSAVRRSDGRRLLDRGFRVDVWLPLFLRPEHGSRAAPLMEEALACFLLATPQHLRPCTPERPFVPAMAPAVLAQLMSCAVVG